MPRKIDISHKTIVFITIFFLSLWIVFLIKDLLLLLFVAVILVSALSPLVDFFVGINIPKALGILLAYIIMIIIVSGILVGILPPLIEQSSKLISVFPSLISGQSNIANIDQSLIQSEITNLSKNIFTFTLTVFDSIITAIFLLVLTFYMLLERDNLKKRIAMLFKGREDRIGALLVHIEEKLGAWLRGQLLLSIIIGILVYLGLFILNIPYALPLALLAAVMEVVPVIGPIISAIPAVVLAFLISPILGAGVAAMYFVIQQLENHLIVPQVMKRAVGLNPLAVILAIAVGGRLLGFAGALLAVPITVVIQIIVTDILKEKG